MSSRRGLVDHQRLSLQPAVQALSLHLLHGRVLPGRWFRQGPGLSAQSVLCVLGTLRDLMDSVIADGKKKLGLILLILLIFPFILIFTTIQHVQPFNISRLCSRILSAFFLRILRGPLPTGGSMHSFSSSSLANSAVPLQYPHDLRHSHILLSIVHPGYAPASFAVQDRFWGTFALPSPRWNQKRSHCRVHLGAGYGS